MHKLICLFRFKQRVIFKSTHFSENRPKSADDRSISTHLGLKMNIINLHLPKLLISL